MDSLGPIGIAEILGTSVAVASTIAGFVYWVARSSAGLATKDYVEQHVEEELDPIDVRVENALEHACTNADELEELKRLIEGGPNQFDQGMIDFLEENIERTNEIQEELSEIRECISTLKHDQTEN